MFINPPVNDKQTIPILSSPKNVTGYSTKDCKTDRLLNITSTDADINEYLVRIEESILYSDNQKTLKNKIISGKNWYDLKIPDCNGLLFGYIIRNGTKFILNNTDVIVRDNFYIIHPKIDQFLLMSLLNNYYVYFQLEKKIKKYGSGLLKIQKYDVDDVYIPNPERITENDRETLIELASILINTGDKQIISEITSILGHYANITPTQIEKAYEIITAQRLNI